MVLEATVMYEYSTSTVRELLVVIVDVLIMARAGITFWSQAADVRVSKIIACIVRTEHVH
jgi:hypothetical protein